MSYAIAVPVADSEHAILRYATIQLFVLIYLQRFALFGDSFPLSVPLIIFLASTGLMVLMGYLTVNPLRLVAYLMFVTGCLLAYSLTGGSVPSVMELLLTYGSICVCGNISQSNYRKLADRFIKFMIIPACVVLVQNGYQRLTGMSDPLDMNAVVSQSILVHGYNYSGHYPWDSYFVRPNGFFFLEPSFVSIFIATAAVLEILYLRRSAYIILMAISLVATMAASGVILILVAAPFLLMRETPLIRALAITIVSVSLAVMYVADIPLPLVDRSAEFDKDNTSGSQRILLPANRLIELILDPSYLFIGTGAGSTTIHTAGLVAETGNPNYNNGPAVPNTWPIVKIIEEYGMLTAVAFLAYFVIGIGGKFNVPLKIALSVTFLFTGGYLLNPILPQLLILFCFMMVPQSDNDSGARV